MRVKKIYRYLNEFGNSKFFELYLDFHHGTSTTARKQRSLLASQWWCWWIFLNVETMPKILHYLIKVSTLLVSNIRQPADDFAD